jgi:ABC-type uncharacterized transport system ATPase subunit
LGGVALKKDNSNINDDLLLDVRELTKQFPLVLANDAVNFNVKKGEIHCLLGENGAGKTTLAECIYGYYSPDGGEIIFKGKKVEISSPSDALDLGIGMVHQHFMLVEPHSVLENIILGVEGSGFILNLRSAEKRIKDLCNQYHVNLDLDTKIWQLSVGEQQWVEILKALYEGVDLLILDEPTAVLTPQESEQLFSVLKQLKDEGLSIIFITHKLKEVMAVSDRVTVLRKGKNVDTVFTRDTTREKLAHKMVGRDVLFRLEKDTIDPGKPVLEINNIQVSNDMGLLAIKDVNLQVREGEILGIAGVAGNGQKELMESLIGLRKIEEGYVRVLGQDIKRMSTRDILELGVGHIPSDRIKQGLISSFTVAENLILGNEWKTSDRNRLFLDETYIYDLAENCIEEFDIYTPSPDHQAKFLSGGNLQKVILAREFGVCPKLLLADQPCRGLDVGVIEYVHTLLLKLRAEGVGILLISEDLDEIFNITDRIAVIFKGEILSNIPTKEAKRDQIGLLMAGGAEVMG